MRIVRRVIVYSMTGKYTQFDVSSIEVIPLKKRRNDLDLSTIMHLHPVASVRPPFREVARKMLQARNQKASNVFMLGAHTIRSGVQPFIIDLMERHLISCIAVNGACVIHDYEFALIGQTTESVAHYIKDGRFGFWQETGYLNEIIAEGVTRGEGLGECIGRYILENKLPHREISLLARAYQLDIPVTVHIGIGYDIIHQHPNFDGATAGKASYTDFLYFAKILESIEGGTLSSFGSAVMAPEIFLKALSMVRNAARQKGKTAEDFCTLVCDLKDLPPSYADEADKSDPNYYFRPWKTLLVRTVGTRGDSWYVKGTHRETFPELWTAINEVEAGG